ncbi:ROK family transcriptional regulator [Actinotignum urinale]|uniref:ROK family transcriptional regulator n=1 Tax=Actinotignum urinale TaxID=190146 RepID=UPI002A82063F|nr:ROK family transcriptional regulator [Actinotignum urinale]MDY5129584.1 ROK family transcriptional regulator [Actinotignum urinale]
MKARKDSTSIRQENIGLVLGAILQEHEGISRADISKTTGLTRATVSRLVEELLDAQILEELAPVYPPTGRPALPLVVKKGKQCAIGVEINLEYVAVQIIDIAGNTLFEDKKTVDLRNSEPETVLRKLSATIESYLTNTDLDILSVVLCIPGLVAEDAQTILTAPNLGWHNVHPIAHLSFPGFEENRCFVMNEADAAAYAFLYARPRVLTGMKNFLYLSAEVGVGAAIVVNGRVFTGSRGWAGEIGHICVNLTGPQCRCGSNGCLEQYVGFDALVSRAQLPHGTDMETLCRMFDDRHDSVRRAIDEGALALGSTIANVLNLLDLDTVILGGNFAKLYSRMEIVLKSEIEYRALGRRWANVTLETSTYAHYGATRGGCMRALSSILENPARWDANGIPISFP